jgi:hypothetical protein
MVIDRKTGKPVELGDTLIRRDYKGFKHRYEILDFVPRGVWVRKLERERYVYLVMSLSSLQLDEVMV